MSVDCSAMIVFGFQISDEEVDTYCKYCEDKELETDFLIRYSCYDNYGGVFGLVVEETAECTEITSLDVSTDMWKECLKIWHNIFPEREFEVPYYYLMTQWW